jgi:hypothetical protein
VEILNKELVIITTDIIEECLCESLDILEKNNHVSKNNIICHRKIKRP